MSEINPTAHKEVVVVDFEKGIPSSDEGSKIGFRKKDKARGRIADGGAEGSAKSGVFTIGPEQKDKDTYIQGNVRRQYLYTQSEQYKENGPNALSFWVKLPADSILINRIEEIKIGEKVIAGKNTGRDTLGVWTYHWRYGDMGVGGEDNNSLSTDSMMHGYCNIRFNEKVQGRWVRIVFSASAFKQARNYYHFYGARAVTDDLQFFSSLRQLQFRVLPQIEKAEDFQIDQIKLIYQEPTAIFERDFFEEKLSKDIGDFLVPVTIRNPTHKDRRYRVFISSVLGVEREIMNKAVSLTDNIKAGSAIQNAVRGDGGVGVVELKSKGNKSVIGDEIHIPAGGIWKGELIHHIRPEMLGKNITVKFDGLEFYARRDTLTTSVIVWDPEDASTKEMDYIESAPSNADDGNHQGPFGFPKQNKLPLGWRSENIPLNQVGGYFVSVIHLTD
ncbi:MAG: hypothetical protein HY756_04455 [Nitrospirae bacterium]|nr:hypothetical protein [Nitrospirota bacterium]